MINYRMKLGITCNQFSLHGKDCFRKRENEEYRTGLLQPGPINPEKHHSGLVPAMGR
jgi:hypothetical protein